MIAPATSMDRFSKRRTLIVILAALGAATTPCGLHAAISAPRDPRPVVSYLVSATQDSEAWLPAEPELFRLPPQPWNWHIFDPASGRDTLFLKLPSFPLLMQWNPQFTRVEFILGDRVERVPWTLGGEDAGDGGAAGGFCLL